MIRSAIAVFSPLGIVNSAIACSCVWPPDFDEIEQDVVQVSVGRLVSKNSFLSLSNNRYKFSITETFKGDAQESLVAWSSKFSSSCGIDVDKEKTYVIFAYKDGNRLWVGRCSTWVTDHYEKLTREFRHHYSPKKIEN
jgi:hypothetical protein